MHHERRRSVLAGLFESAIGAIDPKTLTRDSLQSVEGEARTVVAVGKAASAMCRGAASILGHMTGICVANTADAVPEGVSLIVADHPVPSSASFHAGEEALKTVASAGTPIIALISGGGSALCEHPIPGVSPELLSEVNRVILRSGASIDEMNLMRRHLSAIKGGGLARVATRPIRTLAISDVSGADPSVIASGPTIPSPPDPEKAISLMLSLGVELADDVREAILHYPRDLAPAGPVTVLADGRTAAAAVVSAARDQGLRATSADWWLQGDVETMLDRLLESAEPGLTVVAGEPEVQVTGDGAGGRNTHAALLAARRLAGSDVLFAAFATDGIDGSSGSAGAVVDGTTLTRGGDPDHALSAFDSGTYLRESGDLVEIGPTGTNVADLWVLWRN